MPGHQRGMVMISFGQFARHLSSQAAIIGRSWTIVHAPALVSALALRIGAQHIGIALRHPGWLSRARRCQTDNASCGAQLCQNSVKPLKRKPLLFRLERNPTKDTERHHLKMALLHQPRILIPDRARPLLWIIVTPMPDKRRAGLKRRERLHTQGLLRSCC